MDLDLDGVSPIYDAAWFGPVLRRLGPMSHALIRALEQLDSQVMLTVHRAVLTILAGTVWFEVVGMRATLDGGRSIVMHGDIATKHAVHGFLESTVVFRFVHDGSCLHYSCREVVSVEILNEGGRFGYSLTGHCVFPLKSTR